MDTLYSVGLDIAKNVFQLHGADKYGKVLFRTRLSRAKVLPFFVNLKKCFVGIEACGGSNYWAREISKLGHEVKIIAPQFVKPFVKSNKTDANDAEAICEAMARPTMRFVPIKTIDQQDIQSTHRIRKRLVSARVALACEVRGLLNEYGIIVKTGIRNLNRELPLIIEDASNELTPLMRRVLHDLRMELIYLTNKITGYNKIIEEFYENIYAAKKITKIPGVGKLAATAIVASVGDIRDFKNSRAFASWLGLVPREYSSGNMKKMMGISKRGDTYIRTMLIHGARAYIARCIGWENKDNPRYVWSNKIKERAGFNKAVVALANKNARTIWALLAKDEEFRPAAVA